MRLWIPPFIGVSLIAAIGWRTGDVAPITHPPTRRSTFDGGDNSLAGQIQTSAVGRLWTYTEVYLQNGIHIRKMTDAEKREFKRDLAHDHAIPIIPMRKKDFRGIVGEVERSVNAWDPRQSNKQNDPKQCIPLFRLMTWLDPHFVEAWTSGAMVIGLGQSKEATSKAKEFLREGMRKNPESVDIPTMLAMLHITRDRDLGRAERILVETIQVGERQFDVLPESEQTALQSAYRWLALVYRNTGQSGRLAEVSKAGLARFPDDLVLPSTSRPSIVPPPGYKSPKGVTAR